MSKNCKSGWCRPKKRMAIYLRDSFTCLYCGKDLHHCPSSEISLDHLVPRVEEHNNDPSNLITACHTCNSARRDMDWREFLRNMYGNSSMWREAYIESQVRLRPNWELANDMLNQQVREDKERKAYLDRKAKNVGA
jgi:hypothetical protein